MINQSKNYEEKLIEFLSEESEKLESNAINTKHLQEFDLCGWKNTTESQLQSSSPDPARFRIRTTSRSALTRSSSSNK